MSHTPKTSGVLTGSGGIRRFKRRKHVAIGGALRHQIPDVHISDKCRIRREVWDFDPLWEFEYSQRELNLMAEKILLMDEKHFTEDPYWLPAAQYMERLKREIYTTHGTVDPNISSGMYWRSHPDGRKVNTDEQRKKNSASYYR